MGQTSGGHAGRDQWDEPLGNLDGLTRVQLGRTFLEAAIAEVRFATNAELTDQHAVAIWQSLGEEAFPVFENHVQSIVSVTVGPTGATQTTEEQRGWLLANADRSTWITLLPSAVALQTNSYERYSLSLGEPLREVLSLFTEVTGASAIQRLGLRFINKLVDSDATSPAFWRDQVRAGFAGPIAGELQRLVSGQHQQVQLELDPTAGARIQSGVFPESDGRDRYGFLIDLDVFRTQSFAYEAEHCANLVRQLNRTALALFAHVLSEEYLAELGPVSLDEGGTR